MTCTSVGRTAGGGCRAPSGPAPYVSGRDGNRDAVLSRYEAHIRGRPDLLAALPAFRDKTLACFCKPLPCHGDVLVRLLAERDRAADRNAASGGASRERRLRRALPGRDRAASGEGGADPGPGAEAGGGRDGRAGRRLRVAVERAVGVTVEAATGDELMTMADLLRQRADRPRERER